MKEKTIQDSSSLNLDENREKKRNPYYIERSYGILRDKYIKENRIRLY